MKRRTVTSIRLQPLLRLSLEAAGSWITKQLLKAKLRQLYYHEHYFRWQVQNGNAGLADTHKRIVLLESDLRNLK